MMYDDSSLKQSKSTTAIHTAATHSRISSIKKLIRQRNNQKTKQAAERPKVQDQSFMKIKSFLANHEMNNETKDTEDIS